MSDITQVIFGIFFIIVVFIISKKIQALKFRSASERIVKDLKGQGALDPSTAVSLPYSTQKLLRLGLRDYRPKALQYMAMAGAVGATEDGRYYLKKDAIMPLVEDNPVT